MRRKGGLVVNVLLRPRAFSTVTNTALAGSARSESLPNPPNTQRDSPASGLQGHNPWPTAVVKPVVDILTRTGFSPERVMRTKVQYFQVAVKSGDLRRVRETYSELAELARDDRIPQFLRRSVTASALFAAMDLLYTSPEYQDHRVLLGHVMADLHTIWKPTLLADTSEEKTFPALVVGLCRYGMEDTALELIGQRPFSTSPLLLDQLWQIVLDTCIASRDTERVMKVWKRLDNSYARAPIPFYNAILRFLFTVVPSPMDKIRQYMHQMEHQHVEWDVDTYAITIRGFARGDDLLEADRIAARLHESKLPLNEAACSALAELDVRNGDLAKAWLRVKSMADAGVHPDRATLSILLENDKPPPNIDSELADIELLDDATVPNTNVLAAGLVEATIRRVIAQPEATSDTERRIDRAVRIYNFAKKNGIQPRSAMALPIIRDLCSPEKAEIDKAMPIYQDLLQSIPADSTTEQVNVAIFSTLMAALIKTHHFAEVKAMCIEMRTRRLSLPPDEVTEYILSMIRATATHEDAFDCYVHARALAPESIDYVKIGTEFIYKHTKASPYPPAYLVFEFISDSRTSGVNSNQLLTGLLKWYSQSIYYWQKFKDRQEELPFFLEDIQPHVEEIDRYIRFQHLGKPNRSLWNALLNAYNFTRDFRECFTLWDELRANQQRGDIDPTTVNTVLDACSECGAGSLAVHIWEQLRDEGFPLRKRNWDGYIECLAKLGAEGHAAAVDIVINEMGEKGSAEGRIPAADLETLRIVLKYSWGINKISWTTNQFRRKLPNLFEEVIAAGLDQNAAAPEDASALNPKRMARVLIKTRPAE